MPFHREYANAWAQMSNVSEQRCPPIRHRSRYKDYGGFRTGNQIKAKVPKRKCTGTFMSCVLVRTKGHFDIKYRVAPFV